MATTPRVGEIVDNYRFLGGDPSSKESWESFSSPKQGDILDGYVFNGGDPSNKDSWQTFKEETITDKAKALAKDYLTKPVRDYLSIASNVNNESVTSGLDGAKGNSQGFDVGAGEQSLKNPKQAKQETLKEGSKIVDGISGVAEVGARKGYAGLGRIEAGAISLAGDILDSDTLRNVSKNQLDYADKIENSAVLRGTKSKTFEPSSGMQELPELSTEAIGSVITSAPAIAAGTGAIPAIFATSALSDYGTSGDQLNVAGKVAHAVGSGAAEALGEKLGGTDKFADALMSALGGKSSLINLGTKLLLSGAKEIPSEEVTTTAQFLLDKNKAFGLNQYATLEDYKNQVIHTAKVAALQGAGMGGAGGVIKAVIGDKEKPVSGVDSIAEPLADANIQANYEAAQAKAKSDAALPKIQEATSLDEAIVYAQEAVNTPINTGLLNPLPNGALTNSAPEAIDAADILGDENVSNTDDGIASMVDNAIASTGDNLQASVGDLSNQPESSGMGDIAGTSTRSSGGGLLAGAAAAGNDTVNRPFATADDAFLTQMRGMTADAKVLSQIDAEIELRGLGPVKQPANVNTSANNPQAQVAGEKIDNEWTAFSPESGTLNIPRSEMPQVKAEHRGAMVNFLNARGIDHVQETVPADSLKPTQQEFSEAKVKKASEYVGGDRSILVSADNHVLDGHHQWLAKLQNGDEVEVIRLNAPIDQLLNDVKEFPSSTIEGGATSITPEKPADIKQSKPKAAKPSKPKTLLARLRDIGGIKLSDKLDITGEQRGFAPAGYNQVFKEASNRSLKGLIESGDLDEYLPYNMRLESNGANDEAFDSTEAYDYIADKIRNGESVLPYEVEEEAKANKYYQESETTASADVDELAELFNEDEINEQLRIASSQEREAATEAKQFITEFKDGDTGSGTREETVNEGRGAKSESQQEVTEGADLLGDSTANQQALADAERAKDAKRNSGNDNQDAFTLTGSNSEADQAAAAGAQDLFSEPVKTQSNNSEVPATLTSKVQSTFGMNKSGRDLAVAANAIGEKDGNVYFGKDGFGGKWLKGKYRLSDLNTTVSFKEDGSWSTSNGDKSGTYDVNSLEDETIRVISDLLGIEVKSSNEQAKEQFADNKVFTADKVAAARARLKSKLGNINSGIDPELLIDGMTIAGAYIESGVRKFSDYAKAMTDDFGDSIKPYLLSFYEAARAYPDIDKEGMTSAESAAKEHQALLTPAVKEQAKEVIGQGVVESPKAKAKPNGQLKLTQDWGVDSIDGWTDNKDGTGTNEREDGVTNGVKEQFLNESKKYLTQVSKLLEAEGYEAHKDQRGRLQKAVSVSESGIATSGEVSLTMRKGNAGVYVDIGTSAIRGLTGNHPQGVSVMIRATGNAETDRYATKGQNIWLSTDLNATELANKLMQTAERYVKNTEQANEDTQNARANQAGPVLTGGAQSDLLTEQPRGGDSEPLDAGMAGGSEESAGDRNVSGSATQASRSGATSTSRSNRNESPSRSREASDAGNTTGTANDVDNFSITSDTVTGEGSASQKYRNNVEAIKLIKKLDAEKRIATPEERETLAKYAGFGALSGVFDKNNTKFSKEYAELKELLTPEEYDAARASILNAYYTSPAIVKNMFDAVSRLGFKNGRVLEPSMGSGNFFGMMPASMRGKSDLNGVELDVITSRLAKYLYPKANIAVATGFQNYDAPEGYFDLVISNPPFGSEKISDNAKRGYSGFSIHNYFIAKSIDKLREGGVMAVVVSHSFMDAQNSQAREWISKRANLLGAVRLPKEAFKDIAGTEVITDILYFQKTATPEANPTWLNAKDNGDYSFNEYFYANPRNVLGRIVDTTSQFGKTYTIESVPTNGTMQQLLKEFNERLPQGVYVEPTSRIEVLDSADSTVPDGVKVGTFYKDDKGNVRQRMPDLLGAKRSQAWESPNAKATERMLGIMDLRDLLRTQMRLERDAMASTKEIEANRSKLNKAYDAFLKQYGFLNSTTNRRLFMDDTESALVQALEMDYDAGVTKARALSTGMEPKEASAQKADIFNRRVLFPPTDSIVVNNAQDALLQSLDAKGRVDVDYMAEVYNKPINEIVAELGDVVMNDPTKGYVTADEYLSGDVKTKLAEAKKAALTDGAFQRNVEALEKVIPKDKLPSEIFASAGANWIPADVYEEFAAEITGVPKDGLEFNYVSAAATWVSDRTKGGDAGKMTSDYGTGEVDSFKLFGLLINGRSVEVKKSVSNGEGGTKSVVDVEKTDAANAKYQKIKEFWNSWIFSDPARADRLAAIYNEKHNRTVARKYDGSHMNFYGMSPAIKLIQSQKNVVWRAIQDRNVLFDHVVGAGKTFAMAATAMEMKRLGISRKPMFVVPNHLTLQWRSEFTRLYPASNILAATPEDFAKDRREKMFSKMVTGGYDAIIIGHSSLKKVGLPAEVEQKMYQQQVKEIAAAIESAKSARGDRGITRDMEKIKTNLEEKIKKLKDKAGEKDNVVSWDELSIDGLFIDEMHEFKNLFFTTQMQRTSGLGNPSGSGKALDLFMKVRFMQETIGENVPLITATGTPVSNSLAEMFTMQRYMKYDEMKRSDLHLFDAWAKQYGEVENVYEVAPSGVGYRQSTRFSKFKNLPSLMASYTSFADVITLQDLKDQSAAQGKVFPVPKIKSGKPINVIAQRSPMQRDYFGVPKLAEDNEGNIQFEIEPSESGVAIMENGKWRLSFKGGFQDFETEEQARLELVTKSLTPKTFIEPTSLLGKFANLAQLTRETKGKINALSLTGLANKAGLDYRIIDPSAPDFEGSKINIAVGNMADLWKETAKDKGTQIVFCDMSVPASARAGAASKERYALVRDRNNELLHKKATLHTIPEYEGFPFYIVQSGKSDNKSFAVYEPLSGVLMREGFKDKDSAKSYMAGIVDNDRGRDSIFAMRDRTEIITKDDIDEYFAEQEQIEIADDGGNLITPEDLESIAGSSQFSVYDDIKAKLIARGVPEVEIAFIHDYNTPKQKEDLFKRVNRGEVRFLFGSTPKLGAGTNVQKRLVGLHHIDAPWRPSDLEQREGRIIRQGNELYARDPEGFEVAIYRYATEQTYDTRRWQLLEHKASGIEQLRKYSGESEIEDVATEASNSADMKAAASGNPLVLEETKLRTEVKRLQNLEKAHIDSKFAMGRKIKQNESSINDWYPAKIAEYNRMIDLMNEYPIPSDKDKVALTIVDGQRLTDKEKAENAITQLATRLRNAFNMGDVKVINYRGIDFTIERGMGVGTLKLSSPDGTMHNYLEKDNFSAAGLFTRFNNYIDSFDGRIKQAQANIASAEKENAELKPRLNEPFDQAELLKKTQATHASVQRKLMKSSQLEAVPENQRAEFNRLLNARRETLKEMGFGDALEAAEDDDKPKFSRNQTETPAFKAWFGDSKVVDADGKPLVMYHGTTADFETFKPNSRGAFFFARDFEEAERFADGAVEDSKGDTPLVMPVYLKANNIFDATNPEHRKMVGFNYVEGDSFGFDDLERLSSKIKKAGFDAYYDTEYVSNLDFIEGNWPAIAVFSQNQIKSAIGNNGNFDPTNPDIRFSRNEPFFSLGTGSKLELTKSKAQFGAKVLNKALVKYFGDDWSDSFESVDVPDTLLAYKEEVKVAFGKELRYVSPTNDRFDIFAGVQLPKSPNAIYVNARAETNLTTIAGHELYHTLERTRPDLHQWFKAEAQKYIKDFGVYHENLNKKLQDGEKPHKTEEAMSELLADFTGDALSDVKFLQELANADGNKFKGLLNATIRFLNQAILKLKNLASSRYITDVEALRDSLKKALLAFANGNPIDTSVDEITIESEYKGVQYEQELADAERVFLSNLETKRPNDYFKHRGRATSFVKGTEKASRNASFDIDGNPEAPRLVPERLGKFSEFTSQALITKGFRGESILEVEFYGKEQEELGATDAPAIRVTLTEDGELTVYGADYGSETFSILENKGWASEAKQANGVASTGTPFTRLDHVTTEQIQLLLGDVHARALAWGGVANTGMFWNRATGATGGVGNGRGGSVYFSRQTAPQQGRLTPQWADLNESKIDSLIYTLQDKQVDLKRVTQAIKDAGNQIDNRWNAYLQEELYHGRTAKRTQDFIKDDLEPLIEDMRMRGVSMADFEEYLWMRHAEERNIQIAKVNPEMPDGGSGVSTQEANDYLTNLPAADKSKYEALAKRIDLINRKSRQVLLDYGLEDVATIKAWEGAYKNYVPLMREDMDMAFGNGTGQGFSVKGNASKRATGSNRAVVDIIANIAQQYEKNIIRGEKNRVATALIGLAKLNPNESFWQVDTPPTLKTINKATGLVETRTDPNYKNRDNVVVARIRNRLGKIEERSVVFSQFDERAMRMAASIKNLDQDQMVNVLAVASSFTRYFASINTQYNPVFGIINITRDVQGALLNLSTTPIANRKAEVLKNTGAALLGIYQDLRSERKAGKPANNQWSALFEEFQREGGQTGYRDMFKNAKERSDALRNALDPTWWKESKVVKLISDWLSDYNNALENAVRLSVYKSALDNGSTKQEAASLAKNISVNFNRKGEWGRNLGSIYAFFNASVQGSARIGETLASRDANGKYTVSKIGKRVIQGGLLLGSMQALLLAAAGYGDDDPPEFLRNRSLIIPMDWFGLENKYFTIPMPLGFNAIPAFGRITTEWALSGGKDTQKRIISLMDMLLDVTNPIGNAGLSMQTITPTLFDPLAALDANKDYTGRPIYREDFNSLNPTPGYTRSKDKAWGVSVELARYINLMTGGTDYKQGAISPTADQIEYLVGQFTGGVGREVMKAGTTAESLLTGEDLPPYKIPLVGRFYGNASGQASQGAAFYQNIRELNEHEAEIKGRRENGEDVASYIQDYPEARLAKQGDLAMRQVDALRKRQRQLKEGGASRDAIKKIDERITVIMTKFNERIEAKKEARQ